MSSVKIEDILSIPFERLLSAKLHEVPAESPIDYLASMYKSVSPELIELAVQDSKRVLAREAKQKIKNKEDAKNVNVFFTLGADNMTRSMYTGIIAALLWLPQFIDVAKSAFGINQQDVDTVKKVFRMIQLPHATDAKVNEQTGEIQQTSTCKHYATFLSSIVQWLTTGVTSCHVDGPMKTNLELSRFLSAMALNSFPSIPFTAYYIGSCKTEDMFDLSAKLSRSMDFNKYMTPESIQLNQPMFVVQTEKAPIVGMTGHPLTKFIYGQQQNDNVQWLGLFQESEEFAKICTQHGISVNELKKYMYQTSEKRHQRNISEGNKIALFVEQQNLFKQMFALKKDQYDLNAEHRDEEEEEDEATKYEC